MMPLDSSDTVIWEKEDSSALFASGDTIPLAVELMVIIDSASPIISPTQSTTYYVDIIVFKRRITY